MDKCAREVAERIPRTEAVSPIDALVESAKSAVKRHRFCVVAVQLVLERQIFPRVNQHKSTILAALECRDALLGGEKSLLRIHVIIIFVIALTTTIILLLQFMKKKKKKLFFVAEI